MCKIVIEYDTYFEIKNGLFYPDVPDAEFTFTGSIDGASEDFNRLMELELQREREEILRRQSNPTIRILPNMSEQELIEYFDRISQEEEN